MAQQPTAEDIRAHEHSAWQGAAPLYPDYIAPFTALSGQVDLHHEMHPIEQGETILEVGSGTGDIAVQLHERGADVTGIDFAAEMVAAASARYPDITFTEADVETLPYGDGSFERVVMNYTAHHFARPELAFAEVRRVLADRGVLTIIHPIQNEQPSWGAFAHSLAEAVPSEPPIGGPLLMADDPQLYLDFLEQAGFADTFCEKREKPITMTNLDPIIKGGWAVGMLDQQPKEIQQQLLAGIHARAEPYQGENGSYSFPDQVLMARASA